MQSSNCPTTPIHPPQQQQRLAYIDWLRAVIIALVVAFHCIDLFFNYTYSAGVYLGIVNAYPAGPTRQVAILLAQLCQVGLPCAALTPMFDQSHDSSFQLHTQTAQLTSTQHTNLRHMASTR